ncbi:MAG: sulfurtransferase complex subunit TusB [Methylococcaceae bacterium]|nr:sulfurtransferase complex subunit TusB [Methylococcaceae bacterium]
MLHLIYQSPLELATLERVAHGDSVLFMENASLRLLKTSLYANELEKMSATQSLFVLREELETRGIEENELVTTIQVINYEGFVTLTTEDTLIKTWN